MDIILNDTEIRVLGCLIEKEFSTPDYYPLTLNALVNGCNQKSNRSPVVNYDETIVLQAIHQLKDKDLLWQSDLGRVPKYEERFTQNNRLVNKEAAVMCVLMLRGHQTIGEIRSRSERLYAFESLEEVSETLENLALHDFVIRLSRLPGQKEARFCHLMGNDPEASDVSVSSSNNEPSHNQSPDMERLAFLEDKVESLSSELQSLKDMFFRFKEQFE
ncbi:MAG: YceH family protein [Candidatus Magnetomorum sp.]|nr:YceH family protein [Candidatus Magnetomorum sp.]